MPCYEIEDINNRDKFFYQPARHSGEEKVIPKMKNLIKVSTNLNW